MAAVATEVRRYPDLRSVRTTGTVALSGSYATGGDSLAIPKPGTTKDPYHVTFRSMNGNELVYDPVAKKIKAFSANGTELGAGAYAAGYTGDTIYYDAEFPKLG